MLVSLPAFPAAKNTLLSMDNFERMNCLWRALPFLTFVQGVGVGAALMYVPMALRLWNLRHHLARSAFHEPDQQGFNSTTRRNSSSEVKVRFPIRFGPPDPMHQAIETRNAAPRQGHCSQAVRMGNFLFVSGQLPLARDGQLTNGTLAEETAQALENIRAIVEAAEGTIADIVQCTIYISEIAHWAEVNGIYGAFFGEVPVLPARAVVPVKDMPFGVHIQIQAIAFLKRP